MRAENQNNFKKALLGLPVADYDPTIKNIIEQCSISVSTFYRWLKKPEQIRLPYRCIISGILNKNVSELFKTTDDEKL